MKKIYAICFAVVLLFFGSCSEEDLNKRFMPFDEVSASMYFAENDQYSDWYKLMEKADMVNTFHLSNIPLTCFFVSNDILQNYVKQKGYDNIDAFPAEKAKTLLKYHTLPDVVFSFSSFRDGRLADSTATGDYLACLLKPGEIFLNRDSKVIRWDIEVTNGVMHQLDHVIDPIEDTMYDYLMNNDRYSIFREAVQLTGNQELYSQLNLDYVALKARRTLFVTADETYNKVGINTTADLISQYSPNDSDYENLDNPLNKYVRYHLLERDSYTKDWGERMTWKHNNLKIVDDKGVTFPTMAGDELVLVSSRQLDYLVNGLDLHKTYYNVPVRNGVIHEVLGDLPIKQQPSMITLQEATDILHFNQIAEYRAKKQPKKMIFMNKKDFNPAVTWTSVPDTKKDALGYIIFSSDSYNFLENGFLFGDCLYANLGPKGYVEIETVPVPAGTYSVKIMHKVVKQTGGNFQAYVDDVKLGSTIVAYTNGYDSFPWVTIGEVTFDKTSRHKIKMSVVKAGELHWDMLVFEPLNK
ncbi:MAG: fasciclin domain-containing protein [Bacteroidales bacterium]